MTDRYRLIGTNGSPYSMKMRAIMRYRRLPHDWVMRTPAIRAEVADVKPPLIPILQLPEDGSYHVDSTPMAYLLEERHPGARSIIPDDPGHAFLSDLIEDTADEWGTKAMFHYRWARKVDQDYAARWIVNDHQPELKGEAYDAAVVAFTDRQVGRMPLVGCTPQNAPVIEETYHRVLALLDGHVGLDSYLFGSRPSLADFGWFGQLKTLATDPTPAEIMRTSAQRTYDWVRQMDDLSGLEGAWLPAHAPLPSAVTGLLRLAGEVYLPFLAANAQAAAAGADSFELELLGRAYAQGTFRYQVKCLERLRARLRAVPDDALARIRPALEETGCWTYLAP